jgi:hypothetical protein
MNQEFKRIMEQSGEQPNNCSCTTCATMCTRCPCLGTPSDILALIDAGYIDNVGVVTWAAGVFVGIPPIPVVGLDMKKDGSCCMYDNGLCKLHDTGLKPTEGKLVNCKTKGVGKHPSKHLTVITAATWVDPVNLPIIQEIADKLTIHENNKNGTATNVE